MTQLSKLDRLNCISEWRLQHLDIYRELNWYKLQLQTTAKQNLEPHPYPPGPCLCPTSTVTHIIQECTLTQQNIISKYVLPIFAAACKLRLLFLDAVLRFLRFLGTGSMVFNIHSCWDAMGRNVESTVSVPRNSRIIYMEEDELNLLINSCNMIPNLYI